MPTPRESRSSRWDVLVICTANYCRSPYIAGVLRQALPPLRIASAGTHALVGEQVNPHIVSLLAAHGVSEPVDLPRQLTAGLLRESRLVITAEHSHRLETIAHDRRAADRIVTLKELARFLDGTPAGIGVAGVLDLVAKRLSEPDPTDHDDDLADPYLRSWRHYRRLGEEVDVALASIVPPLRSSSP